MAALSILLLLLLLLLLCFLLRGLFIPTTEQKQTLMYGNNN